MSPKVQQSSPSAPSGPCPDDIPFLVRVIAAASGIALGCGFVYLGYSVIAALKGEKRMHVSTRVNMKPARSARTSFTSSLNASPNCKC